MKDKVVTIKAKGISQKQYAVLLLELNILKKAWKPYGVNIELSGPGVKKIIEWGNKPYVDAKTLRRSREKLAPYQGS